MNQKLPLEIPLPDAVAEALEKLATQGGIEDRGAVFTRSNVVRGMLDLAGYVESRDLESIRLLEPSAGDGEFLFPAVRRLVAAARQRDERDLSYERFKDCIRAVELHRPTFEATVRELVALLVELGLGEDDASRLAETWLDQGDFLLSDLPGTFDVVVGNPPYVRQERIPKPLLAEYRRRFETLYDRADLYVLFFEKCLDLLGPGGALVFICANRWIKNKYGRPLRKKIADGFNVDVYIDLSFADAFHDQVDSYAAITVVSRNPATRTVVALGSSDGKRDVREIVESVTPPLDEQTTLVVQRLAHGADPWLLDGPAVLPFLRDLEARFPKLEETGAKVGIGVATGADRVFIGQLDQLPVEEERKLPLVMAPDIRDGVLRLSGNGVINPWHETGGLADIAKFPRFERYMNSHGETLKRRHVARKNPAKWYKTIDRIYPALTSRPKLLIPDIKGDATVVFDPGTAYPHHNLYVVTSDTWDLRALQAILRSSVSVLFVAAYCVRMAGGFLRFQAQYLRRIRVPHWESLSSSEREALARVAECDDIEALDAVVFEVYRLSAEARLAVSSYAKGARVSTKPG